MFETSLNGPGFSITLWNLTGAAKACNSTPTELAGFLETETSAPAWPNVIANKYSKEAREEPAAVDLKIKQELSDGEDLRGRYIAFNHEHG